MFVYQCMETVQPIRCVDGKVPRDPLSMMSSSMLKFDFNLKFKDIY